MLPLALDINHVTFDPKLVEDSDEDSLAHAWIIWLDV
jgi:hypothetical protein